MNSKAYAALANSSVQLRPVPIKAEGYIEGLQKTGLPGPEQAKIIQEEVRLLQLYERFGAWFFPLKATEKGVFWEVRFPPGSKWLAGPPTLLSLPAMHANYLRNKHFPGFKEDQRIDPHLLLNADKILDQAARDKTKNAQEELNEAALRQQRGKP